MRIPRGIARNLTQLQNLRSVTLIRCPIIYNTSLNHSDSRLFGSGCTREVHEPESKISSLYLYSSSRRFHVCRNVIAFNKARPDPEPTNKTTAAASASASAEEENKKLSSQDKESQDPSLKNPDSPGKDSEGKEKEPSQLELRTYKNEQLQLIQAYEQDEKKKKKKYSDEERKRDYYKKYTVNSDVLTVNFFENLKDKNKETFLASIDVFTTRDKYLRGHVEFIYAALKYMKAFGVHKDLEAYKKLFDVFPKGIMVAQTFWQIEFMHYPKQQNCAIDILEQMEDNGVMGDSEVETMIENIFGTKSFPSRKLGRMMYWMPKFKNLSPWHLPDPLPDDSFELVKLAIQRITSVDLQTKITIYNAEDLEDAVDHTWIVSGQSPDQQSLIESHPADQPIYVEGAFRVWLRDQCINYFILRSQPQPPRKNEKEIDPDDVGVLHHVFHEDYKEKAVIPLPTVHEQEDGIILGCCATGTSSRDSVVSWIRFLQDTNPRLGKDISIVFTLKSPIGPTDNLEDLSIGDDEAKQEALKDKDKDVGLIGQGFGFDEIRPELDQVGVEKLSDTRFVNWPHHFNRKQVEDDPRRISSSSSSSGRAKIERSSQNSKKLS